MKPRGKTIKTTDKILLIFVIVILSLLLPADSEVAFAMDPGGCLTCHQYPGLVKPEQSGGFKALHIDEESYLKSPHGKTDCRECHTGVDKVPHTGETKVNCTNGCHLAEKDKKLIENYDFKNSHSKEKSYITSLEDGSSCRECHRLYPHNKDNLARAFINMHLGFMSCETCHIKRVKFNELKYDWQDLKNAKFQGKPFGTRFNPKLGNARKSSGFISRITAYSVEGGKKKSLMNTWDTKKASAYLLTEKYMTLDEKKKHLSYFHQDINKKEISVACNECHSKKSILDFKQLGFSEKKTKDLISLNIKGLVTKYKIFYFPHLFGQ
jgi:hypothetical protein